MKKISLNNYQAFMLDYAEGNLSADQQNELFAFLDAHPELKTELDEFENFSVEDLNNEILEGKAEIKKELLPDEFVISYLEDQLTDEKRKEFEQLLSSNEEIRSLLFQYKDTLFKPDDSGLFGNKISLKKLAVEEEILVACLEKLLDSEETERVIGLIGTDEFTLGVYKDYTRTISSPDHSIIFPEKESLKRSAKIVSLRPAWNYAAVAASVLLLIGLFVLFFVSNNSIKSGSALSSADSVDIRTMHVKEIIYVNHRPVLANQNKIYREIKESREFKDSSNLSFPVNSPGLANNSAVDSASIFKEVSVSSVSNDVIVINKGSDDESDDEVAVQNRYSTRQMIAERIQQTAWGEDEVKQKKKRKKLSGFDVIAAVAKKIKGLGAKTDAKIEYDEETETTAYVLTLGKISVSKSRSHAE